MKAEHGALVASLKDCALRRDLHRGHGLHAGILREGLLRRVSYVANTLVSMYASCRALPMAHRLVEDLPARDVVTWSALIAGYAQQGLGHGALHCFEQMQQEGFLPNAMTFSSVLKACGGIGAADKGRQIHETIARQKLLGDNLILGNGLVDMYVKCGALAAARLALEELPVRDVISWNTIIAGYAQHGLGHDALACYRELQHEGLSPNAVTFICTLKACSSIGALDEGEEIHQEIAKQGLLVNDAILGNALVDMYAKCGAFVKAERVLKELPMRTTVSWNALLSGYVQEDRFDDALCCYEHMCRDGVAADAVTFVCVLKACGGAGAVEKGEKFHDEIVRLRLLRSDAMVGATLVDMYAKCGALGKAKQVLMELPVQDVVSWNALVAGYTHRSEGEEALICFESMRCKGVSPDDATFTCVMKVCGTMGMVDKGEQLHVEIVRQGLLRGNVKLGTAVVDMYAKCGALVKAAQLLDELSVADVVAWSALIAGYARHGQCRGALMCVEQMRRKGLSPNAMTLSSVLHACSHAGLVDEGGTYFACMSAKFGIVMDLQLYACAVDLFGRAGHLSKAVAVIQRMPSFDHRAVWSALMGACKKWGEVNVGSRAFERAVEIDKHDAAAYICISNIYSAAGMQEVAGRIEAMRERNKARRKPAHGAPPSHENEKITDSCMEMHEAITAV